MLTVTCLWTLAGALWLGSSLGLSAPMPTVGSWVWNTDMRPPVGDSSLNAACSAGPRPDWVSIVLLNICGRLASRSWTSCNETTHTSHALLHHIPSDLNPEHTHSPLCTRSGWPTGCPEWVRTHLREEKTKAVSFLIRHWTSTALGADGKEQLTIDVWHDEHLRLRKSFLEVVEMDGAVKRDEADFRPSVSGKPSR